ncbi:hypothetical protein [Leekyejoonella antrihumi]|nr:hypothetical protein [Leekyejoonella antrihumi]
MRWEVWDWPDLVVARADLVTTAAMIPPCWPEHPHLIHEIASIAD